MEKTNVAPEAPYFNRLVELEQKKQNIAEDIKLVCEEAKEADLNVKGLKLAVKRHLESAKKRHDRQEAETEAERILVALGEFVNTPLGGDAVRRLNLAGIQAVDR